MADTTDDLELRIWPDLGDPEEVAYLVAWIPPPGLIAGLPNLRAALSVGALARLPHGAALVNAGRGGQLSAAMLDVAAEEPLPPTHPFWHHKRILLTPHVSAVTQADTGIAALIDNIHRHLQGAPLDGLVDRDRGC